MTSLKPTSHHESHAWAVHYILSSETFSPGRNFASWSFSKLLEASLWLHSAEGCRAAIRHRGSERDGGVVLWDFLVRFITRLAESCFGFRPLHIEGWPADWGWGSAAPDFFHRTGIGVEVCRQAKLWFGGLYLKFSSGYLVTYSVSAPQGVFMGSVGPRYLFFMGEL